MGNSNLKAYVSALFDPGDQVACANALTDCKAESLATVIERNPQWVSVNPFKVWKRNDNVTTFRNLVVEYDKGLTVEEQLPFMLKMGFPFTTAVYSGNKSIHFVCSLSKPLSGFDEFREIRRQLDIIFPGADRSMKDPARFTRAPEAINQSTGKKQELLVLDKRVSPARLAQFLARYEDRIQAHDAAMAPHRAAAQELKERGELSESSWRFLKGQEGVREGGSRHSRLYAIVCDLCDVLQLPFEDALALAETCADLQGITADRARANEAEKIVNDVYFRRRPR